MAGSSDDARWDSVAAAAQTGDPKALADLVSQATPQIRAVVSGVLRDRQRVEDVVQVSFVKVCENITRCTATNYVSCLAWIKTVARNAARDEARKWAKAATIRGRGEEIELAPGSSSTPSAKLMRREREERVTSSLALLSEEDRMLVRLRIFDGLPHEQVASRLNLSVDTVKKRFERVRKRLRQALDDES